MFDYVISLDNAVEQYLISISNPLPAKLFQLITEFGSIFIAGIVSLFVFFFLWRKDRGVIKYFITAIITNELLVYILKGLVGRLRPFGARFYNEFDASMPSGHAAISILLYGYIIYLTVKYCRQCPKKNAAVASLAALIVLIGFSRLYLNVHYFSDVLVGYFLGSMVLWWLVKKTGHRQVK